MTDLPSLESMPGDRLLTAKQAAPYLAMSPATLTDLIVRGKVPGVRLPIRTGIRITVEQLRSVIASSTLPHGGRPDFGKRRAS